MKVLIVDDNQKALRIAKARLGKEELEVLCASSGKDCLEMVRKTTPDLILLDLDMPDMSGFEVCKILKSDDYLSMIPVIFLTATDDTTNRINGLDLGAVDYVTKPFDPFELRARVRAALRTKQLQDQLAELNRNLEDRVAQRTVEINQLLNQKDAFINQLSHDLRTPLTPLVALLPMVLNKIEDTEIKKILALAIKNVGYMKNLTEKTLQLAQLNSSRLQLKMEKVDIKDEIIDTLDSLSSIFKEHGIEIMNNINSPIQVEIDKVLIKELVHNLISNSVKYMNDEGTITIDGFQNSKDVRISITDTGIGMTHDQLNHIFEEFYKADNARHDRSSSGLGLSICKRIIEKHRGSIYAESQGVNEGTTVHFTIPL